jgi:hypothetical protein
MTRDELLAAYKSGQRVFRGADLRNADLGGAYLFGADLRNAHLRGADLRNADLGGAYLFGADLGDQWIIQGSTRSDGYQFLLTNFKGEGVRLKAGCRNFTMPEAYAHWVATRGGTPLGDETFDILDNLWTLAFRRGYLDGEGKWIGEHSPVRGNA